ncbi:MAG: Gfo/Idh/MocA family oxidoreductase [Verrucomicrobia bacterium]|nr:Gfo/Idh/MocA family oxidoreductase [Verrucomicrobiota bacterium]
MTNRLASFALQSSRRQFLERTAAAAGAMALAAPSLGATGAGNRVVLGLIGPGGMGMHHLRAFAGNPDAAVAYICDPDENRRRAAAAECEKLCGRPPRAVADMRRVFEDRAVDAVVIATPDHWHTPAALLALAAGKHVYVEKPCSHNIREGRLLVQAASRASRVVQVGTQGRSNETARRGIELLHRGAIGEVLVAKAWNSQRRANIGHVQPSDPPPHLDFDLWLGPAPATPYRSNLLPSTWRWFADFGCGDAGNDGVHELDIARWGLGIDAHPNTIAALGGKYVFDDDQQFPDTQYVVFEYEAAGRKRQLIYEHRIWSPYVQEGLENGNAFYGTEGMMIFGKQTGWRMEGPQNKLIQELRGSWSLDPHHRNFLDAIRNGIAPHAGAATGHFSAALAHLANLATRLGRTLRLDPLAERFAGDTEANASLARTYRQGHWAVPPGLRRTP